ncbi:MAG TPA: hypothetical protein VEI99_08685 [Terriglobales bacterium]|nr:hypothetical protein [Terriglobales bacterium]
MKHAGITRFGVLLLLSTWFANLIPPALAQESEPGPSNEKAQTLKQDDAAKQCFQKFLDLNAGDSLGRQRALRYIHDPELVRARSGAAFRRYHARRPEHLSRADGVLEDEHIGDARARAS